MAVCILYLTTDLINMHASHLQVCFNMARTKEDKLNVLNWAFKAALQLGNELTEGINYHTCHRSAELEYFVNGK
jgi:hypothetical protein